MEWVDQIGNQVNTPEKLERYINISNDEKQTIETLQTKIPNIPE